MNVQRRLLHLSIAAIYVITSATVAHGAKKSPTSRPAAVELPFPPALPDGQKIVTDTSPDFLKPIGPLADGVAIAKTAPTITFLYYPGQDYPGKPWSAWGDSLAANGKYYVSIGDHRAPSGNAFVYEFDPESRALRQLADVKKILQLPETDYTPGKIHGRLDLASDGWIYFSTHRGSPSATTDANHYKGDWILRCNPSTGAAEVVAQGPVPKHCIPNSVVDPERLIFYGGTAPGNKADDEAAGIQFFAYDLKNRKMLYSGPNGPARYMLFARSTGRVYYIPGTGETPLMRYDPQSPEKPVEVPGVSIGIRSATHETPQKMVYTVSLHHADAPATIYSFNTMTERAEKLDPVTIATQDYVASIDADPTGRYLYYVPGAHGAADKDGTPVVQYDVKTRQKKVLAFLTPFYHSKYGCTLKGTYSSAVDPHGDKLYITWNISRGSKAWDCVGLTVIQIPESERQP